MNFAFLFSMILQSPQAFAEQGDIITEDSGETETPDIYYIQPGDKLWNIAEKFWGDPEKWPELWSYNEYITNPHWIYPKDETHKGEIVFQLGTLIDPPQIEVEQEREGYQQTEIKFEPTDATCGPDIHFDYKIKTAMYTVPGFISKEEDLKVSGVVAKAKKNQSMLVEGNLLYLQVDDMDKYNCGDVLTVFRRVKKRVRHPASAGDLPIDLNPYKVGLLDQDADYGSLYKIVGEVKVVHKFGKYVTASIRSSYSEISRGDLVGPRLPVVVQTEVNVPKGQLQGTIIEHLEQKHWLNTNRETVFVDKGKGDGVKIGDTFYVIKQNDEYFRTTKNDPSLPPSVIGRLLVIKVDERSSVAVVTDSSRSIQVGDSIAGADVLKSNRTFKDCPSGDCD